jgi:hypothetical protein
MIRESVVDRGSSVEFSMALAVTCSTDDPRPTTDEV